MIRPADSVKLREMSVVDGHVSFEALSTERTAASVTEHLGLTPTTAREVGERSAEA